MSSGIAFIVIASLYWLFCLFIGVWGYKHTKSSEDFFVAGGSIGPIVLSLSLLATFNSSVAMMGHTGNIYMSGLSYLTYLGGGAIQAALYILIFYRRVWFINEKKRYLTPAEMFGDYYKSKGIRGLTAIVALLMGIPYVALQLIAAGYVFNILSQGILSETFGMYVMGGIVIVYIFLGGLKSAAITDALQGSLMFVALLLGGVYGIVLLGGPGAFIEGLSNLPDYMLTHGAEEAYSWQTGASLLLSIGTGVILGPLSLTWALSAKSEKTIRFAGVFSAVATAILYVILIPVVGLVAVLLHPGISVGDQVLPTLISTAPAFIYAIVGVGIFAAINSTADAYLHASGAMTGNDLYRVITGSEKSSPWVGRIAQLIVVIVGLIFIHQSETTLVYLGALAGALGMQTVPALIGTVFWPLLNKNGIFNGMIVGIIVTILTELVWVHPLGVHSGFWGIISNFVVAIIISVISNEKISEDSLKYFHHHLNQIYGGKEKRMVN